VTRFAWGVASDVGRVRAVNQDDALATEGLFAVADGMGGHRGGEVASRLAVETLGARAPLFTTEDLIEAVRDVNATIVTRAGEDADLAGMGTTLCVMSLVTTDDQERLAVANVGDSRVYLFSEGELEQLTEDHSLVAGLVREGHLSEEEAAVHPQRNILTRALGIDRGVQVDAWEVLPFAGDRFLLCSDGLFNEVSENQIAGVLRRLADPTDAARELVRLANDGGGRDNITVVVVDVIEDEGAAVAAAAARSAGAGGARLTTAKRPVPDLAGFDAAVVATAGASGAAAAPAPVAPPPERPTEDLGGARSAAGPAGHRAREVHEPRPPLITWRVVLFFVAIAAVVAVGFGTIHWYGTSTFFVGADAEEVVIYRGRPGGVLWSDPALEERTGIRVDQLTPVGRSLLQAGKVQPSLAAARDYVDNLRSLLLGIDPLTGTTTTTLPAPTTTARVGAPGGPTVTTTLVVGG